MSVAQVTGECTSLDDYGFSVSIAPLEAGIILCGFIIRGPKACVLFSFCSCF